MCYVLTTLIYKDKYMDFLKLQKSWKWRMSKAGLSGLDMSNLTGMAPPKVSVLINGKERAGTRVIARVEDVLRQHDEPWKEEYLRKETR